MARVPAFRHLAAEPLVVLDPMLEERGHRIRYINYAHDADAAPKLERYRG